MPADFAAQLEAYAEVVVRIGLNLQPGQPLLITEPYELLGVDRDSAGLVEAVQRVATAAGGGRADVIWGDGPRLRALARNADWRGIEAIAEDHARRLQRHLRQGGAFLFLLGSQTWLMQDLPADRVNELRNVAWANFGPLSARLTAGAGQWTLVPAPTAAWAELVFPERSAAERLPALWQTVFQACRSLGPDPLAAWQVHLAELSRRRDELNARRIRRLRYVGDGTDLTVELPAGHVWCTARLRTSSGTAYTVNLPTDEIFTAPRRNSAEGRVRVTRPVAYAGSIIAGIELEFRRGEVVAALAGEGAELLTQLLQSDTGARRLGEVALVAKSWEPPQPAGSEPRLYRHPLLDENTTSHVALGSAYRFCANSFLSRLALNRSLIHVDLPLTAEARY
jgi:aminopeptidase